MDQSTIPSAGTNTGAPTPSASSLVIQRVAAAEGVDPIDLPPLYDTIDTDALDTLVQRAPPTGNEARTPQEIRFTYHGYDVRVTGSGFVSLHEPLAE